MVIAALACFAVLLLAWILAPDERRAAARPEPDVTAGVPPGVTPDFEAEPAPAA